MDKVTVLSLIPPPLVSTVVTVTVVKAEIGDTAFQK